MKVHYPRVFLAVPLALATSTAFAEDYQCRDNDGCAATISTGGVQRVVNFRKGDVVSTDSGWVIAPDDGWAKIRSRKEL